MSHRLPLVDAYGVYMSTPIGEQMSAHLSRRTAVRHATPLLPRSWAELLAPWRGLDKQADRPAARPARGAQDRLAPHAK